MTAHPRAGWGSSLGSQGCLSRFLFGAYLSVDSKKNLLALGLHVFIVQ